MFNHRIARSVWWALPLLAFCLSGCGEASTPSLSFMYWSNLPASQSAYNTGLARFHKKYPALDVTASPLADGQAYYEKLLVLYAAQSAPDVYFITNPELSAYATRGGLLDLTSRVDAALNSGTLHIPKADLTRCSTGHKVYGVPWAGTCYVISNQSKQVDPAWTLIEDLIEAGFPSQ